MSNLSNFGSQVCTKYIFAVGVHCKKTKQTTDVMTKEFLLHKDKKGKEKPCPQKQEFSSPSLQASLRCQTHAFLPPYPLR